MEGWIVAASVITALAALLATGAAIWLAILNRQLVKASQKQVAVSQEQVKISQEQLDSQQRPLLIPVGTPIFHPEHDNWLKWEVNEQPISLRNLGTGTAFNIASILYGCTAYIHDSPTGPKLYPSIHDPHWSRWLGMPIAPGEQEDRSLLQGNDHIGDYSFKAPEEPGMMAMATQGALWRVARLTTTYHDISGRKYASIFDYVRNLGWYKVDVAQDITRDLFDMEGYYRGAPEQEATRDQTADQTED
jgi:hypothetical protein